MSTLFAGISVTGIPILDLFICMGVFALALWAAKSGAPESEETDKK